MARKSFPVLKIEITLGNDAMQTERDVADLLIETARRMRQTGSLVMPLFDDNGNCVGSIVTVNRRA